jgi:glycosyltransferase involved in cell wall biosynthesis
MLNNEKKIEILISVIIPCRNEENFIESTLESILNQTLSPENYEVIVVDGMSTDKTREIIRQYTDEYKNLFLFDNIEKITPFAMNIGIRQSSGKYVAICGAHTTYAPDFLEKGLELLSKLTDVDCVGGPIISEGSNAFSKSVALAMSSLIGIGNAKHRFPNYEGYAEMACFPIFRRSVFESVGLYDESLVRNHDDELCLRLRNKGGKIFISPSVKSFYYVRSNPKKLFFQYFSYGYWRWIVSKMYKMPIAFRQFVPTLFIIILVLFLIAGITTKNSFIIFLLPVIYVSVLLFNGIKIGLKKGFSIGLNFIFAVLILHFSYGIGFLTSLIEDIFKRN